MYHKLLLHVQCLIILRRRPIFNVPYHFLFILQTLIADTVPVSSYNMIKIIINRNSKYYCPFFFLDRMERYDWWWNGYSLSFPFYLLPTTRYGRSVRYISKAKKYSINPTSNKWYQVPVHILVAASFFRQSYTYYETYISKSSTSSDKQRKHDGR